MPGERGEPTPLSALDRPGTGIERHFLRDHFGAPDAAAVAGSVAIDGAVERPAVLGLDELRDLPAREQVVVLECAGHRRDEHRPTAEGLQWGVGAVAEARWRGTPLRALLELAAPLPEAVEVVLHGADGFARSLPLAKALADEPLVVWEVDGGPLPADHGAPLRVVVPGWYATDAVKWLTRVEVVTEPFEGHFQLEEYRWQAPGDDGRGERLEALRVHSLVTAPDGSAPLPRGPTEVRGVAWSDGAAIARVEWRADEGPWQEADAEPAAGRFGFTRWRASWDAEPGWHVLEARATDTHGRVQPDDPEPNEGGYVNNAVHKLAVEVEADR